MNLIELPEINDQIRDRLFKAIFGRENEQSKQWRLELYNALRGTNYNNPDDLIINTIDNVIYLTMRNDISFLVDSQMTLFEQQSTYNPNMPLRGLMYFAQLYQMHLSKIGKPLFRSSIVKIPNPQFIVFYNGQKKTEDVEYLKLSDAFEREDKSGNFEWTAKMININPDHNSALQKKCKPLYNYVQYISRITTNKLNGMNINDAVNDAVDWAIKENLLDGFFKTQKEEVLAMSLTEFNAQEVYNDWLEEGREVGYEEGKEEGANNKAIESAKNLLKENISPEIIAKCIGIPIEQVLELQKTITVNV